MSGSNIDLPAELEEAFQDDPDAGTLAFEAMHTEEIMRNHRRLVCGR